MHTSAVLQADARDVEDSERELLRQWHAQGLPYCTLRAATGSGGDLDLLIPETSLPRSLEWLREHGFVQSPNRSPFKLVMLRYRHGRTICLDIHWKAVQYGMVYMDEERMLARRVEVDGVFQLSVEDQLLHLVWHNFLRKGPLRPPALQQIKLLLQGRLDHAYLREHLDAFGLTSTFEAIVASLRRPGDPTADAERLRRRALWAVIAARPGNGPRRLGVWLRSHLPRRSGGLIALVGPDGSGKSTVIKTLTNRARAIPALKIDATYLGPWGQMRSRLIPALRQAGIRPTLEPAGNLGIGARFSALVKGYLFYAAMYVELIHRYVASVLFNVRKGHWVVSDRYITDLRYMYKERPIQNYGVVRRLLCSLFPSPDLMIVLDNRPDVTAARKSGLTAPQIDALRRACLDAARGYRHEVVSTDRTPEEIADHVLNRMLALRAFK